MTDDRTTFTLRFADLDALGHVNSLRLAELVESTRMGILAKVPACDPAEFVLKALHLEYMAPAKQGSALEVLTRVSSVGRTSIRLDHIIRSADPSDSYVVLEAQSVVVHVDMASRTPKILDLNQRNSLL